MAIVRVDDLQGFIDLEVKKAEDNYNKGIYNLDKAIGQLAGMSQLAAFINDVDRIEKIGSHMWALREENDHRLTKGGIDL
jgi:hypothetical protein